MGWRNGYPERPQQTGEPGEVQPEVQSPAPGEKQSQAPAQPNQLCREGPGVELEPETLLAARKASLAALGGGLP